MKRISVFKAAGDFAENKDIARNLRTEQLMPSLRLGEPIVIDFTRVSLSTQSFVHALISDAIRQHGAKCLDRIKFKGCNEAIQALVSTVCDYMQDSTHNPEAPTKDPLAPSKEKLSKRHSKSRP